jgi:hypothetical protein
VRELLQRGIVHRRGQRPVRNVQEKPAYRGVQQPDKEEGRIAHLGMRCGFLCAGYNTRISKNAGAAAATIIHAIAVVLLSILG